jgi:hypothetical protein
MDASGYALGAVLMQGGRHVCYHSKLFHGAVLDYPTYDKDIFVIVQAMKKWKHYLLGKEIIIHIDHHPLQYLKSRSKMHQVRNYKWLGFLQQFHLLIKYNKGATNKLAYMLSRPPLKEGHEDFRGFYKQLKERVVIVMEGNEYHLQYGLFYKLEKLCIPRDKRVQLMRESHTSRIIGNFDMTKIVENMQQYVYWLKMQDQVEKFVKGYVL